MIYKTFAATEKKVSLLGYGGWGIGKTFWIGADDTESKRTLHRPPITWLGYSQSTEGILMRPWILQK